MLKINCKCPKCGDIRINAIWVDATAIFRVSNYVVVHSAQNISPELYLERMGKKRFLGYKCVGCGKRIARTHRGLFRYLTEHGMLQKT